MPSCCFIFSFQYIVLLFLGKHVLYWSFDTLENVILMQGNEQMDYDALVDGQVKCTFYLINLIIKLYSFIKTPHSKKSNLQRHGKGHDSTFNFTEVSLKLQDQDTYPYQLLMLNYTAQQIQNNEGRQIIQTYL